jgi:hypothetical protein
MAATVIARRLACLGAAVLLAAPATAGAEVLIDPTRSPLGGPGGTAAAAPASRLQMIVRGPGETRTAIIDGVPVRVGDTVRLAAGPARVERITDTSVVLARGPARETLQLLPGLAGAVHCVRDAATKRPDGC